MDGSSRSTVRAEAWVVFLLALAAAFWGVYTYLYLGGHVLHDLSRLHPLPELAQYPLLLLSRIWLPLATYDLASGCITALCGALAGAWIYAALRGYRIDPFTSLLLAGLTFANPFFFYYTSNGQSEMPFYVLTVICMASLMRWHAQRRTIDLLLMAFALSLGLLCRMDVLALAAGVLFALLGLLFFAPDDPSPIKDKSFALKRGYAAGTLFIVFIPLAYAFAVWCIASRIMHGEWFRFLWQAYNSGGLGVHAGGVGVLERVGWTTALPYLILLAPMVAGRVMSGRILQADFWSPLMVVFAFFLFHRYFLILPETRDNWLRLQSVYLPVLMAWLPYELSRLAWGLRALVIVLALVALVTSAAMLDELPTSWFRVLFA